MPDPDRTASTEIRIPPPDVGAEHVHLAIAWSADQPELVGTTAPIAAPRLLGRGATAPDDPAPRVTFATVRPYGPSQRPPLAGAQLSRRHLLLEPAPGGALAVRSIGRHPLFHNGQPVTEAIARPGDTLRIVQSLVLLVVSRPLYWIDAHRAWTDIPFPFGALDAHAIAGEHPAVWKLRDAIRFAAQSRQHVLVQGESGSGKELVARAIHTLSARNAGPFVTRNAATLPEGLVDAELFGSVRGYPHAQSPERPGLIGEADGGTLFLDEVAELPHELQAHLLRVLDQGGEYHRLGDARTRRADVRLVAATNRGIGALKHDLAARFALRIEVPGLNERREDVPFLLRLLLAAAVREHPGLAAAHGAVGHGAAGHGGRDIGRLDASLDPLLVEALLLHRYTHHVRELNQILWLALSTSRPGRVELTGEVRAHLQRAKQAAAAGLAVVAVAGGGGAAGGSAGVAPAWPAAPVQPQGIERHHIEAAFAQTGGKIAPAARLLGLKNRHVLYRMMERYGIRAAAGEDTEPEE